MASPETVTATFNDGTARTNMMMPLSGARIPTAIAALPTYNKAALSV